MNPKPGYKTTEFWLTALQQLLGWSVAGGMIPVDFPHAQLVALAANAVTIFAYAQARGKAKSGGGQ